MPLKLFELMVKSSTYFYLTQVIKVYIADHILKNMKLYYIHLLQLNDSLRPVKMNNTCPLRITATAGTKLVGPNLKIQSIFFFLEINFTIQLFIICFIITGSNFRSLSKIPHCCLVETGPCLSPGVVELPLSTTKDRRFGNRLYYQLPNPSYRLI